MESATEPNQVNFLTWGKVDISKAGVVTIEVEDIKAKMSYNSKMFDISIETVELPDSRLSNVWGGEIYRISLTAKKSVKSGKYEFTVEQMK